MGRHHEAIVQLLKQSGEEGVHSFTLSRQVTHKATTRVSELRKWGYPIERVRERLGSAIGVRYFLREQKAKALRKQG